MPYNSSSMTHSVVECTSFAKSAEEIEGERDGVGQHGDHLCGLSELYDAGVVSALEVDLEVQPHLGADLAAGVVEQVNRPGRYLFCIGAE